MPSYVNESENKYGITIGRIMKRKVTDWSSVDPKNTHTVAATAVLSAQEEAAKRFIEDIFGSKVNLVMTSSTAIQPAYAGADPTELSGYIYSIGPATYIFDYPPTSWANYLVKMFRLNQ